MMEDDKVIGDYEKSLGQNGDLMPDGQSSLPQVLLMENYSLEKMSAYEFRKWLFEKENAEDPRKVWHAALYLLASFLYY